MYSGTWKSFRLHNGSGEVPPDPSRLCLSAQARLSPAHIPGMTLMEILLGACANGDVSICCATCPWLFLSWDKNSQRGKNLAEEIQQLQLCLESSPPPAHLLHGDWHSAEGLITLNISKDFSTHPGNLADVPGGMMVFYPWKFSSQKGLTCSIGDSHKFRDVLSMYRSWLRCNFTAMHEVTSELIHPSKLDFSSLSASLLPFRRVQSAHKDRLTSCLNSSPGRCSHGQAEQAQRHKFTWSLGRLGVFFQEGQNTTMAGRQSLQPATERQRAHFSYSWI